MDDNMEQEYGSVFVDLLLAIKEKIVLIIVVSFVAAMIGWTVSSVFITPKYEASVNMIVNTRTDLTVNVTNDNISSAKNLVDTYAIIIKSNTILNQVIENLDLDMSYEEIYNCVNISAINNTQVMKIAAQYKDSAIAAKIVETISLIAPDIITEAVEAGSCKVVSQVYIGKEPIFPNTRQNTVISGLIGTLVCVAVIVLRELLNDYIVDDYDIQKKLKLPVLGVIPDMEGK